MATSLLTSFQCCAYQSSFDNRTGALNVSRSFPYSSAISPSSVMLLPWGSYTGGINSRPAKTKTIAIRATISDNDPNESDKEDNDQLAPDAKSNDNKEDKFRKDLERIVGKDDSGFSGLDLATLIRNKYGRSYDVTLIKKEFMGRNLLAMNVMWKYREQQSFPLTEEEYLLRLDDVANNLKCWGAVSHIRNSLAKVKERPRIGKAVSIFIDMDETGERANEWIYR